MSAPPRAIWPRPIVLAAIRSEVMGDFHEPYGATRGRVFGADTWSSFMREMLPGAGRLLTPGPALAHFGFWICDFGLGTFQGAKPDGPRADRRDPQPVGA